MSKTSHRVAVAHISTVHLLQMILRAQKAEKCVMQH